MNLRRITAAAVLFSVTLGAYWLDGRRVERNELKRASSARLLPKPASGIDTLDITVRGDHFTVSRVADTWGVSAPIKTGADSEAIRGLIDALDKQTVPLVRTESIRDWAPYGLEKPGIDLSLEWGGIESTSLQIGNDSPVKGQVYARLAGRTDLLTIDSTLRDQLVGGLYAFRDKRLLTLAPADINALSLTHDGVTIEARKKGKVWNLIKPIQGPADGPAIEAVINELKLTKPAEFITTATMELARFGLDVPKIAATAATDWTEKEGFTGKLSTILIGLRRMANPPTYFATLAGSGEVFTVPQSLLERLRTEPQDLRNKDIFTISENDATSMTLTFGRSRVALNRGKDGVWRDSASPETPLDQNFTRSMVSRALKMKVVEHLATQVVPMQSGLDDPNLTIQIDSAAKREGLKMGRTVPGRKLVYASTDASPDAFALDDAEPGRFLLTRDDFEDKSLFEFDPAKVVSIEIVEGDKHWAFERQRDYWLCRPAGGKDVFQIRSSGAEHFVLAMQGLRWKRKLDPNDATDAAEIQARGLSIPRRTIRLLDARGSEIVNLAEGGSAKSRIFVRRGGKDDFAVDIQIYGAFIESLRDMFAVN